MTMRSMSHQPLLTREMNSNKLTVSIYPYFCYKDTQKSADFQGIIPI